jgi:iron(III) transport system substrate-binding protein
MKKLRPNIQLYTKSGGGGTLPVGLGQAGGGIILHRRCPDTKAKGYDVTVSFPKEGIRQCSGGPSPDQRCEDPALGKKAHRLGYIGGYAEAFRESIRSTSSLHIRRDVEPSLARS